MSHATLMEVSHGHEKEDPFRLALTEFYRAWFGGQRSFFIRTSGTTGKPKQIKLKREKMIDSARMTLDYLNIKEGCRALLCLSPQYIAGKMMMVRAFEGALELHALSPATQPLEQLNRKVVFDFAAMVPLQLETLVNNWPQVAGYFTHLSKIIVGGGPVDHTLIDRCHGLDPQIFQTFGMTETVSHIALRRINGPQRNQYYNVLPGIEIATDARGCLKIKGSITDDKWLITNDMVDILDGRQFAWKGRIDNVINTGGIKVFPEEIESRLEQIFHDWNILHRFFVTGMKDARLGQKIVLIMEAKPSDMNPNALLAKLKPLLPQYLCPKALFLLDQFVYTSNQKLDRAKTKALIFNHETD